MHQTFGGRAPPESTGGAYSTPPRPPSCIETPRVFGVRRQSVPVLLFSHSNTGQQVSGLTTLHIQVSALAWRPKSVQRIDYYCIIAEIVCLMTKILHYLSRLLTAIEQLLRSQDSNTHVYLCVCGAFWHVPSRPVCEVSQPTRVSQVKHHNAPCVDVTLPQTPTHRPTDRPSPPSTDTCRAPPQHAVPTRIFSRRRRWRHFLVVERRKIGLDDCVVPRTWPRSGVIRSRALSSDCTSQSCCWFVVYN